MSEETFGPQGKRTERPSHEEQLERFTRAFGFEPEPKYEPEEIPPESWDPERKSMWAEYFKRHPEARPKPREIKKLGRIAPGVDGGEYLAKLIEQIKGLAENYAIFEEKLAAFEQKQLDECTSRGPQWAWVDSECLRLDITGDGANPENSAAQKSFTKSIKTGVKTRDCGRGALCKSNGILHEHSPSGGIFGYELS